MTFFCFRFPVGLFGRTGISTCQTARCICWVLVFASSWCWNLIYVFTVMIHWRVRGLSCEPNNQLNVLYHFRNWGWGWACKIDLSPPVIHYWPFQGGSSVVVLCCLFLVSEFLWCFTLCMFLLFLVRFGLLSGHLLGTSCSLGWPYVLCILIICNLSCFQLWFEGWIWILIVSVPGLCILFTIWHVDK